MERENEIMEQDYRFTRHARERSAKRGIPPFVADAIMTYGHSHDAGDGARKYSLVKESMRELRRDAGRALPWRRIKPLRLEYRACGGARQELDQGGAGRRLLGHGA